MKIEFHKMHGIGNDYIYIDGITKEVNLDQTLKAIIPFCDRRKGIGSDGVIFLTPSQTCDGKMQMFNIDAGRSEMCGNGARCCIKLLSLLGISKNSTHVTLETDVGVLLASIKENDITMKMYQSPTVFKEQEQVCSQSKEFSFYRADIGNPHAVIACSEVEQLDVEKYGKPIENNLELFPNRTNVEFYKELKKAHLFMRVWERGSGETQACGTGAACVAGVYRMLNKNEVNEVQVDLLGGSLFFKWDRDDFYMRGGATYVYKGQIEV